MSNIFYTNSKRDPKNKKERVKLLRKYYEEGKIYLPKEGEETARKTYSFYNPPKIDPNMFRQRYMGTFSSLPEEKPPIEDADFEIITPKQLPPSCEH